MENRQWKYVIVDMADGEIRGTDDERVAEEFAKSDENYVIEMATTQVVGTSGGRENIHEQSLYQLGELDAQDEAEED